MTTTPDGLPPLRDVIARHGLRAKKSMGQNFLLDLNLTRKIARAAGPLAGHAVIEVGPGPGGLTRALLLEGAEKVIAIERDERALPALEEIAARWPGRLQVIAGDALQQDWPALAAERARGLPVKIVANLPYNIATPLLVDWLTPAMPPFSNRRGPLPPPTTLHTISGCSGGEEGRSDALQRNDWPPFWTSLTLMFQREVAERICAAPRSKARGRLAILSQWRARPEILFDIPPSAFTPPPKVTSSLVRIAPLPAPAEPRDPAALRKVAAAAFGQRRKMLRKALKALGGDPLALLARAGVDPTRRAEELSVDEFRHLARAYEQQSSPREAREEGEAPERSS